MGSPLKGKSLLQGEQLLSFKELISPSLWWETKKKMVVISLESEPNHLNRSTEFTNGHSVMAELKSRDSDWSYLYGQRWQSGQNGCRTSHIGTYGYWHKAGQQHAVHQVVCQILSWLAFIVTLIRLLLKIIGVQCILKMDNLLCMGTPLSFPIILARKTSFVTSCLLPSSLDNIALSVGSTL